MKTKDRVVLGVISLLVIVGMMALFTPFNVDEAPSKATKNVPKKFSLIDVNKASISELERLPGVGKVKATAIVEYRQKNGAFSSVIDLKNVKGIGEATLRKFENMLTGFTGARNEHSNKKLMDLNSADVESLESLPMIGPVKAKAIVEYRALHGAFHTLSDLKKVKGIGDKTLKKIEPFIIVK